MCRVVIAISSIVLCGLLLFQEGRAAVVEVAVTIKSVDLQSRQITVAYKTTSGPKIIDLDVSRRADITVAGASGTLKLLTPGQKITVSYENEPQIVTKIVVVGGGSIDLRDGRTTVGRRLLAVDGKPVYLHGVNLPWLDGAYGHDIGISPEHPDWRCAYNSQHLSSYMADMRKMNLNVVRVWLFEGLQGLVFDANGFVSRLDPMFERNVEDMLRLARQHQIALYLCLGNDFMKACQRLKVKDIEGNEDARNAYLTHAVIPLARLCEGKPFVFAFDIFNEPEQDISGRTGNWTKEGWSWETMREFIKANANAIHRTDPSRLVSCGSGWHGWENVASGYFSGLGLDFYDIHVYFDDCQLPPVSIFPDKLPVIVGEYGQSKKSVDYTLQETVARTVVRDALCRGYAGTLIWAYGYPGERTPQQFDVLVQRGSSEWRPVGRALQSFTVTTETLEKDARQLSATEKRLVGQYRAELLDPATNQRLNPYTVELRRNRLIWTKDGQGWWCVEDNTLKAWFPDVAVEPIPLPSKQPFTGMATDRRTNRKVTFTLIRLNSGAK